MRAIFSSEYDQRIFAGSNVTVFPFGKTPEHGNLDEIYEYATKPLADAIMRCLEVEPEKRFQSAEELVAELERWKGRQTSMARSDRLRYCNLQRDDLIAVLPIQHCFAYIQPYQTVPGGLVTTASGAYVNQLENLAVVNMDPGKAVVTAQQSVEILSPQQTPATRRIVRLRAIEVCRPFQRSSSILW